jgi:beta-barrel assembly-enhancing protease
MGSRMMRDLVILLVIAGVLFVGGYFMVREINKSDFELSYQVSIEQEEELGNALKDMMIDQYTIVEDNLADSAIQVIKTRLITAIDSTPYRYEIKIIRNEQINAFTMPGGNIYIFSGLIKAADSPEEVAAVLAHEIGHAEKRHVVTRLINDMSVTAILSILSGGDPSMIAEILKSVAGNKFNREQEMEADKFGLQLLEDSQVPPKALARFFERLNDKELDYNEDLEILMTHPHNNKRIEQARKYKTRNNFKAESFNFNWENVQKSLE